MSMFMTSITGMTTRSPGTATSPTATGIRTAGFATGTPTIPICITGTNTDMHKLARAIAAALWIFSTSANAHPGHDEGPPVTKEEVTARGGRLVAILVNDKKLAPSWEGRPVKDATSRETSQGPVWIVSLENPAEADRAKRTVYFFFDEFGGFLGGNYSGKLQ